MKRQYSLLYIPRVATLVILLSSLVPAVHSQWVQQGPAPSQTGQVEGIANSPVTGAVNCVAPHPTDPTILYIGAVNGGVWKTTNATASPPAWTLLSGTFTSQAIGALEIDPTDATSNTVVAGLGFTSSIASLGVGQRGVYKSVDGGATWNSIDPNGTFTALNINAIAPRGTVLVAATSSGIFRTIDNGNNWTLVSGALGTGLPAGASFHLGQDPANPLILYTHAGSNGIFQSNDQGATWAKISNAAVDANLIANTKRVEFAVGNAGNLFVAIVNDLVNNGNDTLSAIFRFDDATNGWATLDLPMTNETIRGFGIHPGTQGSLHLSLAADPNNANVVYVGGDRQPRNNEGVANLQSFPNSINAGNFTGRLFRIDASLPVGTQASPITHIGTAGNSSPHADSRDMDFDANGDLIEGDDGGVYKQSSPENAAGDWASLIGNLSLSEAHSADWDAVSGLGTLGMQDNGAYDQSAAGNLLWTGILRGDGGDVGVDDITSAVNSTRFRSTQALGSFRRHTFNAANVQQNQTLINPIDGATGLGLVGGFPFVTPIKLNSQNPQRLIILTNTTIYESLNQGATCTNLGLLPTPNLAMRGQDLIAYGAADNAEVLYIGNGASVMVRTAATPAQPAASAAYTFGTVRSICVNPALAQNAFVLDDDQVFVTPDAGGTWNDITGNLGNLDPGSLRSVAYVTKDGLDLLAVGTDAGVFVAAEPNFNVWSEISGNLPNCMVLDLEYDAASQLLLASTLGRGTWTYSMAPRDPVDVALVLDLSGSMLSPACATCQPKLDVLKEAVEIFGQLWKVLAVGDDRMAQFYFRTQVTNFAPGGNDLFAVLDEMDNALADLSGQTTQGNELTAMGGGLQLAINELQDDTRPRNIILFTDGMQNVNPGVVLPSMEIQDGIYGTNSNVNATNPVTTLDAALGIEVHTIGVGASDAFQTQLADIAASTTGLTAITTEPDEQLRRFFVEQLVEALRDFSPQLVKYRSIAVNDVAFDTVQVNEHANKVIFKVSYRKGDKVVVNLFKEGKDVTRLAQVVRGAHYQIYSYTQETLLGLAPGTNWNVRLGSGQVAQCQLAVIADEHDVKYKLGSGNRIQLAGKPIPLSAEVLVQGARVSRDVTVMAKVIRPTRSLGSLLSASPMPKGSTAALEPGMSLGSQKLALLMQDPAFRSQYVSTTSTVVLTPNASGIFEADFSQTLVPGSYIVEYTITGTHPVTGPFKRVEQRTIVVRFAEIDLKASDWMVEKGPSTGAGTLWTWTFKPKDKNGNYLGPDFGSLIQFQSPDGKVALVEDKGDGTYVYQIESAGNAPPMVSVGLNGVVWYEGALPEPRQSRLYVSLHGGAAHPIGPLGGFFATGGYLKADMEYRIRRWVGIQLVVGAAGFEPDLTVGFATLQPKLYLPLKGKWSVFAEGGPAAFAMQSIGGRFGFEAGAGADFQATPRGRISLGASLASIPSEDFGWLGLGLGLHYSLTK